MEIIADRKKIENVTSTVDKWNFCQALSVAFTVTYLENDSIDEQVDDKCWKLRTHSRGLFLTVRSDWCGLIEGLKFDVQGTLMSLE